MEAGPVLMGSLPRPFSPIEKRCRQCGEVKPIGFFHLNGAGGRKAICSPCTSARRKERATRSRAAVERGADWPSCECGCGQAVLSATVTDRGRGHIKGEPLRCIKGHSGKPIPDLRTRVEPETGCVVYVDPPTGSEYEYRWLRHNGKPTHAHRIVWEKANGPIPDGYHVHHRCENKACINLEHLELLEAGEHSRLHHLGTTLVDGRYVRPGT